MAAICLGVNKNQCILYIKGFPIKTLKLRRVSLNQYQNPFIDGVYVNACILTKNQKTCQENNQVQDLDNIADILNRPLSVSLGASITISSI